MMRYDFLNETVIEHCSQCSMNRRVYPQLTNCCLCYKDKDTETTIDGFPKHCKLKEIKKDMELEEESIEDFNEKLKNKTIKQRIKELIK